MTMNNGTDRFAQLEQELARMRDELDDFRYYLPDALVEVELSDGCVSYVNRMATLILGYTAGDLEAGLDGYSLLDDESAHMVAALAEQQLASAGDTSAYRRTGTQDLYEVVMVRKDGSRFPAEVQGSYVLDEAGEPTRLRFLIRDNTERKRAEESRERFEQTVRTFAQSAPVVLFTLDDSGTFTFCEGKTLEALAVDPHLITGRSLDDIEPRNRPLADLLRRAVAGTPVAERMRLRDRLLEIRAQPTPEGGAAGVATDITELDETESALRQAQKMESLGVLAGSVAHDFNNVLTTVLGVASLLGQSEDLTTGDREGVGAIEEAARRGAGITARLLAFARAQPGNCEAVETDRLVDGVVRMAAPALAAGVTLETVFDSRACVDVDVNQVEQALLNIILNANDAIDGEGTLRVATSAERGWSAITVEDSGTGMDEQTRARIFEPFFTTKPRGKGTGLGLAITYNVIKSHGGAIDVASTPGEGTRFTIWLPEAEADVPAEAAPRPEVSGKVLVVDDDDMVRKISATMLEQLGVPAVSVAGGQEATEVLQREPSEFGAVLLDLVMPGMSGSDTFHALRTLRADLPVIVCTGYAADGHIDDAMRRGVVAMVRKPFARDELAEALRHAGVLAG